MSTLQGVDIHTRPKIKIRISFLAQIRDHIRESEPPIFIVYYDIAEKSMVGAVSRGRES